MLAIYKKELRSYFINPVGYVFTGIFLLISALLCCYSTLLSGSYDTGTYFLMLIFVMAVLQVTEQQSVSFWAFGSPRAKARFRLCGQPTDLALLRH